MHCSDWMQYKLQAMVWAIGTVTCITASIQHGTSYCPPYDLQELIKATGLANHLGKLTIVALILLSTLLWQFFHPACKSTNLDL